MKGRVWCTAHVPAVVVCLALTPGALAQAVLRVDGTNGSPDGDGSAWGASAFRFLTDALGAAGSIGAGGQTVQVWVVAGTYRPDQSAASPGGSNDYTKSLAIAERVQVYGGFAGDETDLSQRDPSAHVVTLSGLLTSVQAAHVVTITNTSDAAVLDGVTVTGGYAADLNGLGISEHGGGILILAASPRCRGVRIVSNRSNKGGGGVYVGGGGSPVFSNCEISSNVPLATVGGGGIFADGSITVADCLFVGNVTHVAFGGAVYCGGTIARSTFQNNRAADGEGGAVAGPVTCSDCTFTNNTAAEGGAMYKGSAVRCTFTGNSTVSANSEAQGGAASFTDVFDCTFVSNLNGPSAQINKGGAVYGNGWVVRCVFISNQCNMGSPSQSGGGAVAGFDDGYGGSVMDCTFISNTAVRGGAIWGRTAVGCRFFGNSATRGSAIYDGDAYNCVFSGNTASTSGAVAFTGDHNIVNCTFYGNTGAAVSLLPAYPAFTLITNSIFWQNTFGGVANEAAQIRIESGPKPILRYSFVQGLTGALGGVGNIGGAPGADPLFVNPVGPDGVAGTPDDALGLRPGSPCIDAGDNVGWDLTSTDVAGGTRRLDDPAVPDTGVGGAPVVDMGAYEYACLADYDGNGFVNGEDFDLFAADFAVGDPRADVDRNGFVNGEDFDLFSLAFNAGC